MGSDHCPCVATLQKSSFETTKLTHTLPLNSRLLPEFRRQKTLRDFVSKSPRVPLPEKKNEIMTETDTHSAQKSVVITLGGNKPASKKRRIDHFSKQANLTQFFNMTKITDSRKEVFDLTREGVVEDESNTKSNTTCANSGECADATSQAQDLAYSNVDSPKKTNRAFKKLFGANKNESLPKEMRDLAIKTASYLSRKEQEMYHDTFATAPLCPGHGLPAVLRKVKKEGTNKGRPFWSCICPTGGSEDVNARCNFFVWADRSKKAP